MVLLIAFASISLLGLAFGIRPRILTTDSMYPSIYRGSLVLINTDSAWNDIEEGDIVVFRSGSTEVMHRVSEITDAGLILMPDNGSGESLVTKNMYAGKEIIAFPFIGEIIKPVLQHGKAIVIVLAMTMIVMGCWFVGKTE